MPHSLSLNGIAEGNYSQDLFTQKYSELSNSLIPALLMAL